MLNYIKTVLSKVSFDPKIFEKELKKAIQTLIADDLRELKRWCYANYYGQHQQVLQRCFVMV